MDIHSLLAAMRDAGVNCHFENALDYFLSVTGCTGRIVCAEHSPPIIRGNHPTSGISFWVHVSANHTFVGLWSGLVFHVDALNDAPGQSVAVRIARDLLEGKHFTSHGTPSRLPAQYTEAYNLRECEIVEIWPANACDLLTEARKSQLQPFFRLVEVRDAVTSTLDSCVVCGTFSLRLGYGKASALLTAPDAPHAAKDHMGMIMYSGISASRDHHALLSLLETHLDCALYDPTWGNRIHLNDPYYDWHHQGERPVSPSNAVDNE